MQEENFSHNSLDLDLFKHFETSRQGLSGFEVEKKREAFGKNELTPPHKPALILVFFEEFKDLMVIILLLATGLAFWAGETADAIIIFIVVLINAIIGFIQKYKAEKAVEALKKMIAPQAKVLRQGHAQKIPTEEIVPGDILLLEEGDYISADAVLFEANEMETQEAILTGESTPVSKTAFFQESNESDLVAQAPSTEACLEKDPTTGTLRISAEADRAADEASAPIETSRTSQEIGTNQAFKASMAPSSFETENRIFMGTTVIHGTGKAVVIATGMKTDMGKIATLTGETKKDKSPLEKELHNIGIFVGKLAIVISGILFLHGVVLNRQEMVTTLLFAISVAVAAVPEGLPATITIALALGIQKMARKNAIVKQLSSIETLGATTVICSDKTGTLTKNEMTVKELSFDRFYAHVSGTGYHPLGMIQIEKLGEMPITIENTGEKDHSNTTSDVALPTLKINGKIPKSYELLIRCAALCNNASLLEENGIWKAIGDPTEAALITLSEKSGTNVELLKKEFEKVYEYSFDSTRKSMTVLMRQTSTGKMFVFSKGAAATILKTASHQVINEHAVKFDEKSREKILSEHEAMAEKALRVLGFAYRELSIHEQKTFEKKHKASSGHKPAEIFSRNEIEKDLVFLGLAGMIDPPRPEVKQAVAQCKKAGIRIIVITGDHGSTAKAIAQDLGLFENQPEQKSSAKNEIIISGDDLESMSDRELKNLLAGKKLNIIFARVSPSHKLRIVSLLKEQGEIVAVTGDGVNDAPALKRADIGIAMGSGTDVSKEASNMVLADDSFSTIVKAVEEGRTIYENLTKFIFFIFSSNIGELVVIFGAILWNFPTPLPTLLILFVNLTTDVFPAIALGLESTQPHIMENSPRPSTQKILNTRFLKRTFYVGGILGILAFGAFIWDLSRLGNLFEPTELAYAKATSLTFMLIVTLQLANAINARSSKNSVLKTGLFGNRKLFWSVLASWIISLGIIEIPWFQRYFRTAPLDTMEWFVMAFAVAAIIMAEEVRKWLNRRKKTIGSFST